MVGGVGVVTMPTPQSLASRSVECAFSLTPPMGALTTMSSTRTPTSPRLAGRT